MAGISPLKAESLSREAVMQKLFAVVVLLAISAPAVAQDDKPYNAWSHTDTVLQVTLGLLVVADVLQTHNMLARDDGKHWEENPVLGRNPSDEKLVLLAATGFALHTAVTYFIPSDYRTMWQAASIVVESSVIAGNYQYGAKVTLRW
jgi:hypothetical protein